MRIEAAAQRGDELNAAGQCVGLETDEILLGLEQADRGSATIGGKRYAELREPLTQVGALLEARALHPGRSARNHLRSLAASQGIGSERVEHLLELVGLAHVADKRVKGFSLGMGQRLGVAVALANAALFVVMALHDERTLASSPLAEAYAAYRRRVGVLLLLPRRARDA